MKEIDLTRVKECSEIQVETAPGEIINCLSKAKLDFHLNEDEICLYKTSFYILNFNSKNVISGLQFLKEKNAIINLKDNCINLYNREYDFYISLSHLDKLNKKKLL
ncbi:hypothetical protein DMUE_4428 [Dictyocoela muelleri]|nr:hypothetical protein DMUE_4428 [Dictyocoela muelleri]